MRQSVRIFLALLVVTFGARAEVLYHAPITQSQWNLSASIFGCKLTHTIPGFGQAVFFREAGEPLKFYLTTQRNPLQAGKAALVIEAPPWRPGQSVDDLGLVPVRDTNQPVTVGPDAAERMLDSLLRGMQPTVTRQGKFVRGAVRVAVNAVNFSNFYNDYLDCVATLLPVNFRQVERTKVFFDVDSSELTDEAKKQLDKVVLYVKADPTVTQIFVDGHTDASGRRIYNLRLSRERAENVTRYLVSQGLDQDMIVTRYHGDRYPVIPNTTPANKAQNRRATIRLDRTPKVARPQGVNAADASAALDSLPSSQ